MVTTTRSPIAAPARANSPYEKTLRHNQQGESIVKMGIYARVSSEAQEARGTIGSQLEGLRAKVAADGDELVAEFVDDGCSGARLDRPGLDALRDAVEAGLIEAVWCLTPDRLSRSYAYQVLITDELARYGVAIRYLDAPPIDSDPQARLLTQIQAVVAEYERAKIIERYRRGKLYRARAGEVLAWRVPYGFHRVPRSGSEGAHVEVNETQAVVVRRIFDDYVVVGRSIRQIVRVLNEEGIPAAGGGRWHHSVVGDLLRNEAYVGRLYWNRTELVPDAGPRRVRQVRRPHEDWICIPCPSIVGDDTFEAVQRACRDNVSYSTRRLLSGEEAWLLRGLVVCGACGVHAHVTRAKNKTGAIHRYYRCKRRDPVLAGGQDQRCREAHIRADALDDFVFDQLRCALSRPEVLVAGETALAARTPTPDDELLGATMAHLERKLELAHTERRRLADLYQAGLLEMVEVQRRVRDIDARHRQLSTQRDNLIAQREDLVADNQLRRRVADFAQRVVEALDELDFAGRQRLVRLLVEHVRVTGSHVELQLRIPLDEPPNDDPGRGSRRGPLGGSDPGGSGDNDPSGCASDRGAATAGAGDRTGGTPVSSNYRLRPLVGLEAREELLEVGRRHVVGDGRARLQPGPTAPPPVGQCGMGVRRQEAGVVQVVRDGLEVGAGEGGTGVQEPSPSPVERSCGQDLGLRLPVRVRTVERLGDGEHGGREQRSGIARALRRDEATTPQIEGQTVREPSVELLLPHLRQAGSLEALGELDAVGLASHVPAVGRTGRTGPGAAIDDGHLCARAEDPAREVPGNGGLGISAGHRPVSSGF